MTRLYLTAICVVTSSVAGLAEPADSQPSCDWPADWQSAWADPPVDCRPLQIVHSLTPEQASPEALAKVKAAGLGGFVCNVNFDGYVTSEKRWGELEQILGNLQQAGLLAWIYDEKGYPSGAAGGEVLKTNPAFEAQELAYDPAQPEPFTVRRAFEHSHASNNFYACRRSPNIIDDAAMRCFIEVTHEAYAKRIGRHFGSTVRAFFTDEPSLMAVNIGALPEHVRAKVPVVDPVDPNVKPLPTVPWVDDLPELYRKRWNVELPPDRRSLFEGNSDGDRLVRKRFWSLIADLVAERYFGRIQDWCRANRVASSGHSLHEEQLIAQVPLAGNSLKALSRMDIPGLDVLTSDPHAVVDGMWLTASLPVSAAVLNGRRFVMTEVSDFAQRMATGQPAPLPAMQATAAWQAALGVTEFTLYYDTIWRILGQLPIERMRDLGRPYTDHVGRLNALLRSARPVHRVLLYYPILDLWEEYLPISGPLTLESQSPRARQIVQSFHRIGHQLLTRQISFLLADHELLTRAEVHNSKLRIGGVDFDALLVPAYARLPEFPPTVEAFLDKGGLVIQDGPVDRPLDLAKLEARYDTGLIAPASPDIVVGRFERDARQILLVVNVGSQPYAGLVRTGPLMNWSLADPATGKIEKAPPPEAGRLPLKLGPHAAIIMVSGP
ncbi:MAG TPA: hypothetical protein VLM89_13760 [Phycisphaerae bacterium]|nr:hypothetical protein [Phycisphaerae bacterium]